MEVFLGGTCNNSLWRETIIPLLECDYFNPVVKDWTEDAQKIEEDRKRNCEFALYVITPKMTGVYSIAEAVDDSNKKPTQTFFCILDTDGDDKFTEHQLKSLEMTKNLLRNNNARVFETLEDVANFINYMNRVY